MTTHLTSTSLTQLKQMDAKRHDDDADDDLEALRLAALNSMRRTKPAAGSGPDTAKKPLNKKSRDHLKGSVRRTHNFLPRGGSQRSNLIVLTACESEERTARGERSERTANSSPKKSDDSQTSESREDATSGLDKKRVLPGRFSRIEREESEDSEWSDEHVSDADDRRQSDSDTRGSGLLNGCDETVNSCKEEVKKVCCLRTVGSDCATESLALLDHDLNKNNCDRRETLKLHANVDVSNAHVLEKRRHKFGETISQPTGEAPNNSNSNSNSTSCFGRRTSNRRRRSSAKRRLDDSAERSRRSKRDEEEERNRKKLRSLVVLKAD